MTVVVALSHGDVLWARLARTPDEAKLHIYNDVMRQLHETCGDEGLNIRLTNDSFDEHTITTTTDLGDVIVYKEMDNEHAAGE